VLAFHTGLVKGRTKGGVGGSPEKFLTSKRYYEAATVRQGKVMDVQIRVAEGPDQLAALGEWLSKESELRGRVWLCNSPVGGIHLRPVPGLLLVTLSTGNAIKVLVPSLISWLQTRQSTATVTAGSGGHHVTLNSQTAGEVRPLLEQILLARSAGATITDTPRAQSRHLIDQLVLAAHLSGSGSALVRAAEMLAALDPDRAELIARSIPDESARGSALACVVKALAPASPDRAKRVARSITCSYSGQVATGYLAEARAATDPDQALQLIELGISTGHVEASALDRVARVLATSDPERAELIAMSITDERVRALALTGIARVRAATDPDGAERIARSITDEESRALALSGVAGLVAPADPARAERIAWSVTGEDQALVLCFVAQDLAGSDPDRAGLLVDTAEHRARLTGSEELTELVSHSAAVALAIADPDRAERTARSITDEEVRASALNLVSVRLASTDPDRAERIARSIPSRRYWHTMETSQASALRQIAETLAATDPDRAERTARSITAANARLFAMGHIAAALAATDPDRAECIAWSVQGGTIGADSTRPESSDWFITGEHAKAWALGCVARELTSTYPDRAIRLIADAEQLALSPNGESEKVQALMDTAKAIITGPNPDIDGPPGNSSRRTVIRSSDPPAEHFGPQD
jgi:hypothetical protein